MNQENKENSPALTPTANRQFEGYYFVREEGKEEKKAKGMLKKNRRGSQGKIHF